MTSLTSIQDFIFPSSSEQLLSLYSAMSLFMAFVTPQLSATGPKHSSDTRSERLKFRTPLAMEDGAGRAR